MGRKKKAIIIEEPDEIPTNEKDLEDLSPADIRELEEQEKTEELLADFKARFTDQAAKILVEKYDEEGDWAICRKYPLASFEQEHVKAEFGGGKYRGILLEQNGKYVKGGRINFKFAEAVNKDLVERRPENPFENPAVAMILKSMESNQHMMMEFAKTLMTGQSAGAQAAGGKNGTLGEVVEVVKSLNSMTPKEKPLENFKETLTLLKLMKDATGEGEEKGGILSEIREFLEVAPMLKEQLGNLKVPAQVGPAGGVVPQQGQAGAIGEKQKMDPLTKKIVELVPKFVGGAQSNAPIVEWGAYLLEVFDTEIVPILLPVLQAKYKALVKDEDDVYDVVLRLAQDPMERTEAFKQIVPLQPYQVWCNAVIDEAIRLAAMPDVEDDAPVSSVKSEDAVLVSANGKAKP